MMSNFSLTKILSAHLNHVLIGLALIGSAVPFASSFAETPFIIVQSTTSTQNSGLYDYLLPKYTQSSGVDVRVVAVGTGQALRNAERCDGDVLIVHSKSDEVTFVKNGFGTARHDLMYNDFIILGPQDDPAAIGSAPTVRAALQRVADKNAKFASRGDNSGTNKAELRLWTLAERAPNSAANSWYLETGLGMGATLNFAVQTDAYTLSDRATWLAFANRGTHKILFQGHPPLFNQYGIIPVSKAQCPNVKQDLAEQFTAWMTGPEGQNLIASYTRNGAQLFFPNAK